MKSLNKRAVILDLIKSSKGVTIPEILKAVEPDISKQYVYTTLHNLVKGGKVRKNGKVYVGKRAYTKRAPTAKPTADLTSEQAKAVVFMQQDIDRAIQRINNLEVILAEKEKEVWTLECEVFDKKAIIAYLESKLIKG